MTEQVNKKTDAQTTEIISDDGIRAAIDEFDDPLAPSLVDIRSALEAVQDEASDNPLCTPNVDIVVHDDDTCYVLRDDNHEGLSDLLNRAGIDDDDLRQAVRRCHSEYGKTIDYDWSVAYPLVIVHTDS